MREAIFKCLFHVCGHVLLALNIIDMHLCSDDPNLELHRRARAKGYCGDLVVIGERFSRLEL